MPQSKRNAILTAWLVITTLISGVLILGFATSIFLGQAAQNLHDQRLTASVLIEQIRQSSIAMNVLARSYVQSGDASYRQNYYKALDGLLSHPVADAAQSVPSAQEGLIARLSQDLGSAEEYALLREIRQDAVDLAQTEQMAIQMIAQDAQPAGDERKLALQILQGTDYQRIRTLYANKLDSLRAQIDRRSISSREKNRSYNELLQIGFIVIGSFWLFLLWRNYSAQKAILGASPNEVYEQIVKLGKGDFFSVEPERVHYADSVISWLHETRIRLAELITTRRQAAEALRETNYYLQVNNRILQRISDNVPLNDILNELIGLIEEHNPGAFCSILLKSEEGDHLIPVAGPSLPQCWVDALPMVPIGEGVGACGTSAFRGERVIVEDVQAHPSWENYRELAAQAGLRACWSQPFKNSEGGVLGTFAIYRAEPAVPSEKEIKRIEEYANLVKFAVERARMAEDLGRTQEIYRLVAENTSDVIWQVDLPSLRFSYISPSIERLRGWRAQDIIGQTVDVFLPPEAVTKVTNRLVELLGSFTASDRASLYASTEVELPAKDGHLVPIELVATLQLDKKGLPYRLVGVSRDITERKAQENLIREMAFRDPLTGLANRRFLEDRLKQLVSRAEREKKGLSLLFVDLDKFKPVNDEYGHETGDWILQRIAERMLQSVRATDTVARIGGDEFVVLIMDVNEPDQAMQVAYKIHTEVGQAFVMEDGRSLQVSSSIGVVMYPEHGHTMRELLRCGDEAMYRAKRSGSRSVELYAPGGAESNPQGFQPILNLRWKGRYNSGHLLMDQEHRALFKQANQLLNLSVQDDIPVEQFNAAFDALLASVVEHFAHEEDILREHHYAELGPHTIQHNLLIARARGLRARSDEIPISVGELADFLVSEVIVGHMIKSDSKYFDLFKQAVEPAH